MAAALNGVEVGASEVFSLWRFAGHPTRRRGYLEAAALIDGELTSEVGGATCLLATVVYNTALLGGMEIVERANHSVDSYGDRRYFEIGRDAIIEYGYRDLRFRNPYRHPVRLHVWAHDDVVGACLTSDTPLSEEIDIDVTPVLRGADGRHGVRVTRRRTAGQQRDATEDLGWSWYAEPRIRKPLR